MLNKCDTPLKEITALRAGHRFGPDLVCANRGCSVQWQGIKVQKPPCSAVQAGNGLPSSNIGKITPDLVKKIKAAHSRGVKVRSLARFLHMSEGLVNYAVKKGVG